MVMQILKNIQRLYTSKALALNMYFVFGRETCPYCQMAMELLSRVNVPFQFEQINSPLYTREFKHLVPRRHTTVPVVFFGHRFIGGFAELREALE